jgi:hypothetical protein
LHIRRCQDVIYKLIHQINGGKRDIQATKLDINQLRHGAKIIKVAEQ